MPSNPKLYSDAGKLLSHELRSRKIPNETVVGRANISMAALRSYLSGHSAPKEGDPFYIRLAELIGDAEAGRYEELIRRTRSPSSIRFTWSERILDLIARGRLAEGRTALGKRQDDDEPGVLADCYQHLGRAYFDRGRLPDGTAAYLRAREILEISAGAPPNASDRLVRELASRLMVARQYDEAIAVLHRQLKLHVTSAALWRRLGITYWYANRLVDAYAALTTALAYDIVPARVFHARGQALAEMGKLAEAEADLLEAIANSLSEMSQAYAESCLAFVRYELGETEWALNDFERIYEVTPENAWHHYRWGICLAAEGRTAEAVDHLTKSLEVDSPALTATKEADARKRIIAL